MHLCMQVNRPRLKRRRTCRSCLLQPEDTLVGACKNTSSSIWTMQRTDCPFNPAKTVLHFLPKNKAPSTYTTTNGFRHQTAYYTIPEKAGNRPSPHAIGKSPSVCCMHRFSILQCNPDNTLLITHHGSGRLDIVPGINHSVQLVMLDFIPVITIYPDMSIHPDKSG